MPLDPLMGGPWVGSLTHQDTQHNYQRHHHDSVPAVGDEVQRLAKAHIHKTWWRGDSLSAKGKIGLSLFQYLMSFGFSPVNRQPILERKEPQPPAERLASQYCHQEVPLNADPSNRHLLFVPEARQGPRNSGASCRS